VSIEEKDRTARTTVIGLGAPVAQISPQREPLFINRWLQRPEPDLTKPLGALHWPLVMTGLLCSAAVVLLFARIIDLGSILVGWTLTFNVNIAVALLVLLLGVLAIVWNVPAAIWRFEADAPYGAAICLFLSANLNALWFRARVIELNDAVIEQQVMAKRFRQMQRRW